MRSVSVEVFKASELTGAAKERARDWYRDLESQDFGGHGELWEPAETAAGILGIEFRTNQIPLMNGKTRTEPNIMYSGFSSQGDGASFTGSYAYKKGSRKAIRAEFGTDEELYRIADELAALQRKHGYRLHATITRSGHYVHKYTMDAEVYQEDWRGGREKEVDAEVEKEVLELMRDFAEWIYRGLEDEYNYRQSDEAVDESMDANEYEFTAEGKRFTK